MSSTSSEQWGVAAKVSASADGVTTKKFGKEFDADGDQNINVNLKFSGAYGLNKGDDDDNPPPPDSPPPEDGNDQNPPDKGGERRTRKLIQNENTSQRRKFYRNLQQEGSQIRKFDSNESSNNRILFGLPVPQGGSLSGSGGQSKTESNSESSSSQYDNFARTKKQSEDASKISSKNVKITEVNFGGSPSADWREWAASVKEKPMPISYNVSIFLELPG